MKRKERIGRGERIRTSGLLVPNQALYQAEPRPEHIQCIGSGMGAARPAGFTARERTLVEPFQLFRKAAHAFAPVYISQPLLLWG